MTVALPMTVAALLLLATASTASAGQLPARFDRAAAKLRAVRSEIRGAPTPQPIPPRSANATAAYALLRRDFLFFERFTVLFLRSVSRAVIAFRDWLGRSIGYPPRVMVVTLQGIIAADDEIRGARALLVAESDDLLLLDEEDSSNGWRERFRPRARGRPGGGSQLINLERCERQLERAFSAHGTRAVCLVINSPGGSPVQSSLIYERLRALRKQYKRVPLIAFVEDSACSGGYYIACAADEIIADPSSLVGSVGVISRGFGYVKAIKRQGVSRRVHTAGASKGGVDPYLPMRRKDLAAQARLLREIHTNFIGAVKAGRGDRLRPEAAAQLYYETTSWGASWAGAPSKRTLRNLVQQGAGLFDGSVYSGEVGKSLGLVDKLGELKTEMQARFGRSVRLEPVEEDRALDYYSRLLRWLL